jgi:hypothetical protein
MRWRLRFRWSESGNEVIREEERNIQDVEADLDAARKAGYILDSVERRPNVRIVDYKLERVVVEEEVVRIEVPRSVSKR